MWEPLIESAAHFVTEFSGTRRAGVGRAEAYHQAIRSMVDDAPSLAAGVLRASPFLLCGIDSAPEV
jgi:hypothetical protein